MFNKARDRRVRGPGLQASGVRSRSVGRLPPAGVVLSSMQLTKQSSVNPPKARVRRVRGPGLQWPGGVRPRSVGRLPPAGVLRFPLLCAPGSPLLPLRSGKARILPSNSTSFHIRAFYPPGWLLTIGFCPGLVLARFGAKKHDLARFFGGARLFSYPGKNCGKGGKGTNPAISSCLPHHGSAA
jgi:hypothetical protein